MQGTASSRTRPPGRFLAVEGHEVHFVDLVPEDGATRMAPVVMVHGANGSIYDYLLSPVFPFMRRGRRVLLIHRTACFSRQTEGMTLDLADQVQIIQQVLDALEVERPLLVGHSIGTAVYLAHALQFPGKSSGYVLLAPIAYGNPRLDMAGPVLGRPTVTGLGASSCCSISASTAGLWRGWRSPQTTIACRRSSAAGLWSRP